MHNGESYVPPRVTQHLLQHLHVAHTGPPVEPGFLPDPFNINNPPPRAAGHVSRLVLPRVLRSLFSASYVTEGVPLYPLSRDVGVVVDALPGFAQCAVAPAGKLANSQEDFFLGMKPVSSDDTTPTCVAEDAEHAVLLTTGGDFFSGRADHVRFWQDGVCRVLAKVRWSMSCSAAARVPHRLERRVVAQPNEGDRQCATTRVATLETPKECLSFINHAIIDVDASRAESTHWRNSRLSRHVVLAWRVQRLIVRSVGCRSCVQSVRFCARARQI